MWFHWAERLLLRMLEQHPVVGPYRSAVRSAAKPFTTARNRASESFELFEYRFFIAMQSLMPFSTMLCQARPFCISALLSMPRIVSQDVV